MRMGAAIDADKQLPCRGFCPIYADSGKFFRHFDLFLPFIPEFLHEF